MFSFQLKMNTVGHVLGLIAFWVLFLQLCNQIQCRSMVLDYCEANTPNHRIWPICKVRKNGRKPVSLWSITYISFLKDFGRTVDRRSFWAAWIVAKQVQAASSKLLPWLFLFSFFPGYLSAHNQSCCSQSSLVNL